MVRRPLLLCSSTGFQRGIRLLILLRSSSLFSVQRFGILESQKRRRLMIVKKKLIRSHPGWTGSRVDRGFPGQFPSGFLPPPKPVPGLGRPGPGSTRRAGPGFKTLGMVLTKQ
jgi:hypothetical protein